MPIRILVKLLDYRPSLLSEVILQAMRRSVTYMVLVSGIGGWGSRFVNPPNRGAGPTALFLPSDLTCSFHTTLRSTLDSRSWTDLDSSSVTSTARVPPSKTAKKRHSNGDFEVQG